MVVLCYRGVLKARSDCNICFASSCGFSHTFRGASGTLEYVQSLVFVINCTSALDLLLSLGKLMNTSFSYVKFLLWKFSLAAESIKWLGVSEFRVHCMTLRVSHLEIA